MTEAAGISAIASFIIGLPGETEETLQKTLEFSNELREEFGSLIGIHILAPFPGTEARERAAAEQLFGLLPEPVKKRLEVAGLRLEAERVGITRLDFGPQGGRLEFSDDTRADPAAVIGLVQQSRGRYRMDGPQTLRIRAEVEHARERFQETTRLVRALRPDG